MRWYYWPLFALVMGLMLGGSFAAAFLQPIEKTRTVQTTATSENSSKEKKEHLCEGKPFWERVDCDPVAYFTMWLAAFTFALAFLTGGLWLATQSILRESRRTTEKQLRAYINVARANTAFLEGWRPIFQVVMINGGNTPAYDTVGRVEAIIRKLPLNGRLDFSNDVETKRMGVLGPKGDYHFRLTGKPEIPEWLRSGIESKQFAIFVIGDVHYKDVFGKDWHTEFALVFDDMSLADPDHQLPAWIDGNEAT